MKAALVIGTHLDDAVLSAGQFLAGRPDAVVVTVMAGEPSTKTVLTNYDRTCGFSTAEGAIAARRVEDVDALALLGATAWHLDFVDSQYGFPLDAAELDAQLGTLVDQLEPEMVIGPLGVRHPDHQSVRDGFLEAMSVRETPLYLYEDLPARVQHPEAVTAELNALKDRGLDLELKFIGTGPTSSKMNALWCYRPQMGLPEFENRHCLLVPERFWRVTR